MCQREESGPLAAVESGGGPAGLAVLKAWERKLRVRVSVHGALKPSGYFL